MRKNTTERFWDRVDKRLGKNACWEYQGRRTKFGHGVFDHDGGSSAAHRYAFTVTFGPPVNQVLHKCDNPPCCRPEHLYDGTPADNVRDRDTRKRRDVMGERHPSSKLSDQQCDVIRSLYDTGRYTQKKLGGMYGVDRSTISLIVNRKRKLSPNSRSFSHAEDAAVGIDSGQEGDMTDGR